MPAMTSSEASPMMAIAGLFLTFGCRWMLQLRLTSDCTKLNTCQIGGSEGTRNSQDSGKNKQTPSVRSGTTFRAVDGCMRGEDGAEDRSTWGTNPDANKGSNSARGATQETSLRAGGGANGGPDGSTGYQADKRMLAALGAGGCRDAHDVLAFYRDVGAVFFKREQFIGDGDKFSIVALQAGFDHFDSLTGLQAI